MTTALEGVSGQQRPGRTLPPGKTQCPFYRRLGGPQGRSGRAENLVPTGIRSRTVQAVVSSVAIPTELPGPQLLHLATIISATSATIILPQPILSAFRGVPATHCIRVSPAITRGAKHGALKRHLPLPARAYFLDVNPYRTNVENRVSS